MTLVEMNNVLSSASGPTGANVLSVVDQEIEQDHESASEEFASATQNKKNSVWTANVHLGRFGPTGQLAVRHVEIQRKPETDPVYIRRVRNYAREKARNSTIA